MRYAPTLFVLAIGCSPASARAQEFCSPAVRIADCRATSDRVTIQGARFLRIKSSTEQCSVVEYVAYGRSNTVTIINGEELKDVIQKYPDDMEILSCKVVKDNRKMYSSGRIDDYENDRGFRSEPNQGPQSSNPIYSPRPTMQNTTEVLQRQAQQLLARKAAERALERQRQEINARNQAAAARNQVPQSGATRFPNSTSNGRSEGLACAGTGRPPPC